MKTSFYLLLFSFVFCSCSKSSTNPNQLPPLTHSGQDMMAFNLNGTPIIIEGHQATGLLSFGGIYGVKYYNYDSSFAIDGFIPSYNIIISFYFGHAVGSYPIITTYYYNGGNPLMGFGASLYSESTGGLNYVTDSTHAGVVNVLYYDGSIISGTFNFSAIAGDSVVQITDGEFDIGPN